jgi:hypothetical protein
MVGGYDPAAFDIVREEFRDRDDRRDPREDRDFRDIRDFLPERERERPDPRDERQEEVVRAALEIITNDDSVMLDQELVGMINDPKVRMTRNGEMTRRTGRDVVRQSRQFSPQSLIPNFSSSKPKRKAKNTSYRRAYKKAFKALKPSQMTKKGTWKKGGFKRVVQASHKAARKATKK